MPRCRTERRLRGIASGWCPPGAVRSAGGDEDNLEFVCAVADHATGSAAWQARTKYPLESYERDDYDNDKALIGCPLAELRSGYPGMWNNPACPPTVMTAAVALFATHNAYVYDNQTTLSAAANPRCCGGTVAMLSTSRHTRIRLAAATNPNCPPQALEPLAHDIERPVRLAAATNPNCPPQALHRLIFDDHFLMSAAAATNPALNADTLRAMANSTDSKHRTAAARHPNCPPDLAETLTRSSSPSARAAAAANPALGPARAAELAVTGDAATRAAALTHPACPPQAAAAGCADRSRKYEPPQ